MLGRCQIGWASVQFAPEEEFDSVEITAIIAPVLMIVIG